MIRIRWWLSVPGEIFIWFDLPVPLGEGDKNFSPFSLLGEGPEMRACAHDDDLLNGLGTEPRAVATGMTTQLTIE